ncbi:MAG: histidinol-phosphate transaminase [Leptospiraceae bacterium]|nr:histidinol-phosphate transaminase [Leptospiraceae bacterium]
MDFRNQLTKKLRGYTPGEQPREPGWIKLNTNENPFPPSRRVIEALQEISLNPDLVRRYPSPEGEPLRQELAHYYGLSVHEVLVTNGSDEALSLLFRSLTERGDTVAIPELTYSLYPVLAEISGATLEEHAMVATTKNPFCIDLEALRKTKAKMVVLPNPNAPTGEFLSTSTLCEVIAENPNKLWIIDEAYNDFVSRANASLSFEVKNFSNLVVLRTFSKSHSLAGARIGYILCSNPLIMEALYAIKDSYNTSAISLHLALASWKDRDYWQSSCQKVIAEREKLFCKLENLGFFVIPSEANFLFVQHEIPAAQLYGALRQRRILVRWFNKEPIDNYLRISIGTPEQNLLLIEALTDIINRENKTLPHDNTGGISH